MAWTSPKTWLVGETVTAANMNAHVRDNEAWLRGLTGNGDPPAADYVIASTSTSLSAWAKITQAMMAAGSVGSAQIIAGNITQTHIANGNVQDVHMTVQKVSRVGDTMTGSLTIQKEAAVNASLYAAANIQLYGPAGGSTVPALSFHRPGDAAALYLLSGQLYYITHGGTVSKIWTDVNDGPASTLNADLLDGNDAAAFAAAAHNHSGVYDVVGHTHGSFLPLAGGTLSGGLVAVGFTVSAERFQFPDADNYFQQTGTPDEVALTTGNSIRYRQGNSLATFTTPGVYSTSWNTSDERLKRDVVTIDDALAVLRNLRPVHFYANDYGRELLAMGERRHSGFIAQEVRRVQPDMAGSMGTLGDLDDVLTVDQVGFVPYLTRAVVQLDDRLAALEMAA